MAFPGERPSPAGYREEQGRAPGPGLRSGALHGLEERAPGVQAKEGHGFYKLENNVALFTKMEAFFDKHIGDKPQQSAAN